MHQFRFYRTTSHYLCHGMCYHSRLVEIALGFSRNLMIYSRRFTPTLWPKDVLATHYSFPPRFTERWRETGTPLFSPLPLRRGLILFIKSGGIFNFDLIVLRTSISSICNEILNLNFTKSRSKVIKKLPSASVKPENQNKKSSETSDNLEFSVSEISDSLLETVEKYQARSDPFYFYYPTH